MEKGLMDYGEFKEKIMSVLRERTGAEVYEKEVSRNNGVTMPGMVVKENGVNAAPVICLRSYYESYRSSRDFDGTADTLEQQYLGSRQLKGFDMSLVMDWEKAKGEIEMRLVNYEMNREMLGNVPHMRFLDLAVTFYIGVGQSSIMVDYDMMGRFGKTLTDLYEEGIENLDRPTSFLLGDVVDALSGGEVQKDIVDTEGIYVVTNERMLYGAAAMLDHGFMRDAVNFGDRARYCILPSSVHELILAPVEKDTDIERLREIVWEVNDTQVLKEEVLSYNVYVYDFEKEEIVIA